MKYPYAPAARARGGAGRDHAVAAQRRRRLHQTPSAPTASTPRRTSGRSPGSRTNSSTRASPGRSPPASSTGPHAFAAFARGEVGMLNGHPADERPPAKGVDVGMVPMPGTEARRRSTMGVADWMMAFKQNGHRRRSATSSTSSTARRTCSPSPASTTCCRSPTSASEAMATPPRTSDLAQFLDAAARRRVLPGRQDVLGAGQRGLKQTDRHGRALRAGARRGC